MSSLPKQLESFAKIRFQDCDPFNHLNNAAYINYFINAREDQLIKHYDIDIYKLARTEGKSWVVASNQIAYLKPAMLMEEVCIASQLMEFNNHTLKVELQMWNASKTELKAVLWSNFVHFNLLAQKKETHSQNFMNLFASIAVPTTSTTFEHRISTLRSQMV